MTDRAAEFHALYGELRIGTQKRYYEARRDEYRDAHRQAIVVRNTLLIGAALAGVAGQIADGAARAAFAIGAAICAALAGVVVAFGALIGFPRLSKLYEDAWLNLAEAEIDWDALDPHGDVAGGIDRVEEIFRKENGQWGQLVVQAERGQAADLPVKEVP
ncbi:SLATT domain-containing protein [Actinophytocola sp.]|uniref:SLATT domain-containing protein n=1 Tax=Actinophytocola sp. TaxID=1872138 RepID=UPI002EDAC0B4